MGSVNRDFERARQQMVETDLKPRGIRDGGLLSAMGSVPRHLFVEQPMRFQAYADHPLPIGHGQTISQPYVVAAMIQSLLIGNDAVVLDVGSGCGYQAAILSKLCKRVYGVERIAPLASRSKQTLSELGYHNVTIKYGDGFQGWSEFSPYDGIVVAAWASTMPEILFEQLKPGARLVIPIGDESGQQLTVFRKGDDGRPVERVMGPCAFVPMVSSH